MFPHNSVSTGYNEITAHYTLEAVLIWCDRSFLMARLLARATPLISIGLHVRAYSLSCW